MYQDFLTISLSIVIESLPFVVLGISISICIALFLTEETIIKIIPKNRFGSHVLLSLLGLFAPVCQCGNVPVARRFMLQGLSVSQATTFLIAAPIVNPLTILTTWVAFPNNHSIAIIRLLAGFFIANVIGIFISFRKDQTQLLSKSFNEQVCAIDHTKSRNKFRFAIHTFTNEFVEMMLPLCMGAMIAGVMQVVLPKDILLSVGQNIFLSVFAMLTLGFIISICSTVDAFFALSYVNTFTTGSILTFLIFGPIADIKMLVMMKSMFKTKIILYLLLFIAAISVLIGLTINMIL